MEKCTVKQVLAAIKNSGGIKTNIARKLRISRLTVDNYEKKYPSIMNAIKEERDQILDKAESNIFGKVNDGDLGVSQWLLRYKGDYNEKQIVDTNVNLNAKVKTDSKVKISPKIAKMIGDALAKEEERKDGE